MTQSAIRYTAQRVGQEIILELIEINDLHFKLSTNISAYMQHFTQGSPSNSCAWKIG